MTKTSLKAYHTDTIEFLKTLNDEAVANILRGKDTTVATPTLQKRARQLVKESRTKVSFLIRDIQSSR